MIIVAAIQNLMASLLHREEGQGMAEYALILALVSIAAIATLTAVGGGVVNAFNTVVGALP
ncbi:MAG: Flp family type IVb pilin [Dehalococcoidia bacterium]